MFPRHQEFRRALDDVSPATAARECQEQAKLTLHVVEPWKPTGCLATPQCKNGSLSGMPPPGGCRQDLVTISIDIIQP
ncbi:hypothetical protein H4I95_00275 [Botrytis cinerea]